MSPNDILADVENKWSEHLEMLAQEEKFIGLAKILAQMLHKAQGENIYLRRRLEAECIRKSA